MIFSRLSLFMVIASFLGLYPLANMRAFDGEREGFFFGTGIGFGVPVYNAVYYDYSPFLSINYKIGYAPSEQTLIYWTTRSSLNRLHSPAYSRDFYTTAMAALGFIVLGERHNNFYLFWELGLATTSVLRPEDYYIGDMLIAIGIGAMFDSDSYYGLCMSGGIGYEISPNLVLDFTLTRSGFNDYGIYEVPSAYLTGAASDYVGDIVTFSLAFNVLFY